MSTTAMQTVTEAERALLRAQQTLPDEIDLDRFIAIARAVRLVVNFAIAATQGFRVREPQVKRVQYGSAWMMLLLVPPSIASTIAVLSLAVKRLSEAAKNSADAEKSMAEAEKTLAEARTIQQRFGSDINLSPGPMPPKHPPLLHQQAAECERLLREAAGGALPSEISTYLDSVDHVLIEAQLLQALRILALRDIRLTVEPDRDV